MKKKLPPVAFMSYVRFDDKHENGRLTEFRDRLSGEIHLQTGEEFLIFQDRNDILWGQKWRERIEQSIDESTFLIPIITPGFFKSEPCRDELELFLKREKKLKRNDLILPVYYVGSPLLDDEAKRAGDKLAKEIWERNYADWRDLRFEPTTSSQASRTLAKLAVQIRDALERIVPPKKTAAAAKPAQPKRRPRPKTAGSTSANRPTEAQSHETTNAATAGRKGVTREKSSAKTEPPIRIVDPLHRGNHSTISEAIENANPGDRILVRPGVYQEGLVIDKPLEIIGDGAPGDVVIQATGKHALLFKTTMGRVLNLTLQQMGGGQWHGVNIAQGRLELESCDITSQSLSCVAIHSGADPRLRLNRIRDGANGGIFISDNSQGTIEDNDIYGNTLAGVAIKTGGNPTLRRNRIHDGKQNGVFVYESGQGTLEDNDIYGNAFAGVAIRTGANPIMRRNRIHDGKQSGIFIYENGQGTLEENDIFSNELAGIEIKSGSNPTLRRNRVHDGKQSGVYIQESGLGTLEDNDIYGNAFAGVAIRTDGNPVLRNNRIKKNSYRGIWVYEHGAGTIEDNDLRDNLGGPWDVSADSEANLKRARNQEN